MTLSHTVASKHHTFPQSPEVQINLVQKWKKIILTGKSGHRLPTLLTDMEPYLPARPQRPTAPWPHHSHFPAFPARLLLFLTMVTCHFPGGWWPHPHGCFWKALSAGIWVGGHCPRGLRESRIQRPCPAQGQGHRWCPPNLRRAQVKIKFLLQRPYPHVTEGP